MRSIVRDVAPGWMRRNARAPSRTSTAYESAVNDRSGARATVLAGLLMAGFAGFAFVGLISLIGALGFEVWLLWS
jgi:hypothetical protein